MSSLSSASVFGIPDVKDREKAVKWWIHKVAKEKGWEIPVPPVPPVHVHKALSWLNELTGGHSVEFYTPAVEWIRHGLGIYNHRDIQFDSRKFFAPMSELIPYDCQFDMTWGQEHEWMRKVEDAVYKLYKNEMGDES
jgi:hypothetical protein